MSTILSRTGLRALPLMFASLAFGCTDPEATATDEAADSDIDAHASSLEAATASASPTVSVFQGKLEGKIANTTRLFLGIPYAKAPVGDLRFAPPQPAGKWTGTRTATAFGPSCVQPAGAFAAPGPQSEDCLSLNVYAPTAGSKIPVMVFIHGGAFVAGGSNLYDGQKLSETGNVIVVTLNYRLGALGLLSHPDLDAARSVFPSGNDSFRDQQLALAWVKLNIGAFGGDPNNVTLFGESAGSMSTCLHMVSPLSRPLANRFIMESASCVGGLPISTKAQAQAIGAGLAANVCAGATDAIACLRGKPASEIVAWGASAGISGAGWAPVINPADAFLPAHPRTLIAAGNYNKGNLIVGSNAREWGLFQAAGASPVMASVAQLNATVDATFGPISPYVKAVYTSTATDATANSTYVQLMTDYVFRCPARALVRQTSVQGSTAFLYHFEEGYAFHAFELPYVFGNPNPSLGAPVVGEPLRAFVQNSFTSYAKTGSPNVAGQLAWPTYSLLTDAHISLKASPSTGTGLSKATCDFWDTIYPLI